jgi:Type I phosphodiesterase / nucleotide pyrophosphatase
LEEKTMSFWRTLVSSLLLTSLLALPALAHKEGHDSDSDNGKTVQRVLLISIDGMHAVDFINCSQGVNSLEPYCPHLAELAETGINYLDTSTSKPSDSFPGLTAIVSGGSPRTFGVYYDVAYDRALAPPMNATGNGLSGGTCTPGVFTGTTTEYEEGIDINQMYLNGVAATGPDGGVLSIDPTRLPRDPGNNCNPVYPWNFVRANTIFGVIHQAGGYTAWSDKHPAYSSVSGPTTSGLLTVAQNLDDFYAPEINSIPIVLPFPGCSASDDPNFSSLGAYTDSFAFIKCYDTLKVNAILNEIDGFNHNRTAKTQVPEIFGMNFQAASVGQKLIEPGVGSGGYLDASGTPSPLLLDEIKFVDNAIGEFAAELKKQHLLGSTLIIITAKHGQSPVDSARYTGITKTGPVTTSPSRLIDTCLPDSESNAGGQIGPTEDDVSLLWLTKCTTSSAVDTLEMQSPASANIAGIGQIFSASAITQLFNAPGLPPDGDSRTPDIIVTPNVGVTYSGSTAKQAEHGGFAHDDTNVIMLLSNPKFDAKTVTSPVETSQVAPTILKVLGLDPNDLQAVQKEGTQVLPGISFEH